MPKLFTVNKPYEGNEYIELFGNFKNYIVYILLRRDYLAYIDNLYNYRVVLKKLNVGIPICEILSTPLIGYTETYISVGATETIQEAESILKYIKSKFARCMLGILKVTQDNTKKVWKYVPIQDFTNQSDIDWSKTIPEIDKQLYAKYNFTDEEITFIESKIKPME